MNESEILPERSEEEATEERVFNMVQSVIREMKSTFNIEDLSNIEMVHLKKIVRETLESRDQIEGTREQILENGEEGIKVNKNKNSDISSKTETEIIIRWLDQLYGINPVQVRNLYRQSQLLQIKIEDKTTGESIILRRTGIEYKRYDDEKKHFVTVKEEIYSEEEYIKKFEVIADEEKRIKALGHDLGQSEMHDERLLEHIKQAREDAHLL